MNLSLINRKTRSLIFLIHNIFIRTIKYTVICYILVYNLSTYIYESGMSSVIRMTFHSGGTLQNNSYCVIYVYLIDGEHTIGYYN